MTKAEIVDMVANSVLSYVSFLSRSVFGDDHMTKIQKAVYFLVCIGWVYLVSLFNVSKAVGGGLSLAGGLILLSVMKALISGSKSAEGSISKNVKNKLTGLFTKSKDES